MGERRYPLQALVDASGLGEDALRRRVGLSGTMLQRAREMGLTDKAADRYAVRVGLHPFEVWPEMVDHGIEDAAVECAERSCSERFIPTRKGHRFCS